jgi:hypothetical protein
LQSASVALQVTAVNTRWAQGLTLAEVGPQEAPYPIVVNRIIVNSATTAEVDITIPANAALGATSVTMSTGGEIVTLASGFTVLPYTPTLTLAPSSGMIPVGLAASNVVNVNFHGNFTHFAANSTIAAIDGNGVVIQNFTVLNEWNATAQFSITAPASQASPALLCDNQYGGNRTVTLETPLISGSEIVKAGFCVTSTPAVLVSISPFHSPEPASNLTVAITGQYTHFEAGVTTVGFGPNITVLGVSVTSATSLTATINIADIAVMGWRPTFVNTVDAATNIDEQLTIGFGLDPGATATLASVTPGTGIQGQSLTVQIAGNSTNWIQGDTIAIFGAGITVNSLTINSTTSATAQISIDAVNAPVGGSSVTMMTQLAGGNEEVDSGPLFSVTQGAASVSLAGPQGNEVAHQSPLYQGSIVNFAITGSSTHFLQGETTLSFGSDIAVSQLTVVDATHMNCQIAIGYTATLGYRGFSAITNAEAASSFSDALNILGVEGSSVNITPTSGVQGTTFTIQVNGTNTHWTSTAGAPNNTTASFGNNNGVNVTAITVISATQMTLTVQVLGTAYATPCCDLYTLTITTTGLPVTPTNPQGTEQLILNNVLSIAPGAAIITTVSPASGAQNSTAQIAVTGQNTSFLTGVTTAYFSTGGCNPPTAAGINVSNVTASDNTHATLAIAVGATAPTGYQTLCMYTLGESVSYSSAFEVTPGVPTLNEVSPVTGQQGQAVAVTILGQFTHWQSATTVTFGQGITVQNLQVTSTTSATATLAIDLTAYTGSRTTTVTTGDEIVSGSFFSVAPSAAIISTISPTSANQGQRILMTINGNFTHWSQELTQFSISGGGYDIRVNGLVVNSPTQAVADLSILNVSGNAGLYPRTISMSTVGETVSLPSGLLITGGVASIVSICPNYGALGDVNDNIAIAGQFTLWDSTTVVDFGDPAITVQSTSTVNSNTSLTAVISIGAGATVGVHNVTVRTGASPNFTLQIGQYTVYDPASPPTPYISYEYPSVGLAGQTLAVNLSGAYTECGAKTNWLPGVTTASFGAGILVNSFQVTGLNTATANITIEAGATVGPRTVTVTTGVQQLTTTFYVTVGVPAITVVDTSTAIQGETRLLDLVGQYTTWTAAAPNATVFTFCAGVDASNIQIFGPTAARVQVTVSPEAGVGYCPVTATTGTEVAQLGGGGVFDITPSTATVLSVTPNTAVQNISSLPGVQVVGFATHWDSTTTFSFGGGVNVIAKNVADKTDATLTLSTDLYATPGYRSLTASTGGENATLNNAFVVQPGTPLLLSTSNANNEQQASFNVGILGEYTAWTNANTTVTFPNGGVTGLSASVTSGQSITVTGSVLPTAYPGCGPVVVTTTGQVPPVLTLYGAFCVLPGPAAITGISPNTLGQGQQQTIQITGTNTNWVQGTTVASFGQGISVNTLTINSAASATANVTVAANATPEANTVVLTTAGETASDASALTILATTATVLDVYPDSGAQGQTNIDVCITAAYTHFVNGNTTADFGPGITINSVKTALPNSCGANDATHADVNISISPIVLTTPGNVNNVRLITNLATTPVTQEVAVWQNSSASLYNFTIAASAASLASATPFSPASVHQNDTGDIIRIVGSGTHFTAATPVLSFCGGVTIVGQTVLDDTHITATINVGSSAAVGACSVTVTTGGEVAVKAGAFSILAGLPVCSPNSAHQNDGQATPFPVTITGSYSHFTSGALTVVFPAGVSGAIQPGYTDTSVTVDIQVSPTAALGTGAIAVSDATDGLLTSPNAFTITAGVPALVSASPNTGAQGSTQAVTLTGDNTSWTSASQVTISGGSDVTVTGAPVVANLANGYQQTLVVTFNVTNAATPSARTVQVTTGGQVLTLSNGFTVQQGLPNILQISPNIGVPNSTVQVTITGVFTNWDRTTTVNFGAGISVNGFAEGADGSLTGTTATTIQATLTIDPAAALGTRNVEVTTTTGGLHHLFANSGFQVLANTTTPPSVLYVSPANNAVNVPTNAKVTVTFTEPLNAATIVPNNVTLVDGTVYNGCYSGTGLAQNAGSPSLDVSGRILTLTPAVNLPVGRTFYLTVNNAQGPAGTPVISDQSGNQLGQNLCYAFTTGFAPDNSGPAFATASVANGATGLPINSNVVLGFNKPIDPATIPAGLAILQGANPVPGTWGYSSDFTQTIFTPAPSLPASLPLTVTYTSAITDSTGTGLTNPGTLGFTTGGASDNSALSLLTYTPPSGYAVTGTNPTIRLKFNKPVNPLSFTPGAFYVYDTESSVTALGASPSFSPDNTTVTMNLSGPLLAETQYQWSACSVYDWTTLNSFCFYYSDTFTTGPSLDTAPPSVLSVSPASGETGVPLNPSVYVHLSEPIDPTSVANSAITLSPGPITGAIAFAANGTDYATLVFQPSANLSAGATYTINVSGLMDMDGNAMTPYGGSSFTTGATATADTSSGTATGTPSSGATDVPVNTNIVLTFSKVVDPLTLNSNSVRVFDNLASGPVNLPGLLTVDTTGTIVTYAQASPFEGNHEICYSVDNSAYVYDLAGNSFNYYGSCFTTTNTADTTAPTVVSVSPLNGATGIGPSNPVIVTFSKPINPGTLTNDVALFHGSALVTSGYSPSNDYTTIVFSTGYLPFATTFTVAVSPNITDLAGNHLASEFSSTFTTGAAPVTTQPTVATMRPGSGATGVSAASPVTFFFSAPMNAATLNGTSIKISQNGTLITAAGTVTPSADNQAVTFVPGGGSFQAGALIQAWVTGAATDTSGNPLYSFQSQFSIQADLSATPPTPVSYYPCQYCSSSDRNTVAEILFNKPIDSATLIPANFYVTDSSSSPITGNLSLLDNGRLVRFRLPSGSQFAANSYYYVNITANLKDLNGLSYAGSANYWFQTGATSNLAAPSVAATAPTNGATAIGVNAVIGVTFSQNVDSNTLDPSAVKLNGGAVPLTIAYNSSTFSMTVTPQAPLPASSAVTLTLNGVTDPDGNALNPTPYGLTFSTAATPDYAAPVLSQANVTNGQTNVPVTSSFSLVFNKPIAWPSVIYGNTVYLQDYTAGPVVPGAATPIGSGGILLTHAAPLSVGHRYQIVTCNIAGLNGNLSGCYSVNISFTAALTAPAGGPVVTQIVPPNASVNVPVNFEPVVQFDRPVSPATLNGVTLTQGAVTVAATPVLRSGGTVLTLVPNSILTPNTSYVFTVSGAEDSAGNAQSGSVSRTFTTGVGIDLTPPTVVSQTPIYNSTTGENPVLQLIFNEPLNPIASSSFNFSNTLTDRGVTGSALSWSADFRSAQFTYPGALEPNSEYSWSINSTDLAGNVTWVSQYFYTGPVVDTTPETVTSVTPPNGIGGAPLNAVITLELGKPAAPTSVTNSSVTLSPPVAGYAVQLSPDGMTITLAHATLATGVLYAINVPAGGFTDEDGNNVSAFSSTFTAGTSTDSTSGTISQTSPASGSNGVALSQAITVTFSKPLDPNSLSSQDFVVYENNNSSYQVAGAVSNPTPTTLVFTPFVALPVNTRIDFYVGYYASILDLAGNTFNRLYDGYFTTANTADTTPPRVISVNPAGGATDVGPYAPVILIFNKSLNYNTINSGNFALYNGPNNLGASVSSSADRSVVTLRSTLPYSSTLTVAVSTDVSDYDGNSMAGPCAAPLTNACTYSFSTETPPIDSSPYVIQARPSGSGAALTSPITLFMSSPMSLSTVESGMYVAQNGALISPNSIALTADQQGIVWTPPAGGFAPGAQIDVYLYSPAADTSGNPVTGYSYSFHTATAPSLTSAPTETAFNPCRYCDTLLSDAVVEVQFAKPLNPATVTSSTAFIKLNGTGPAVSGAPVLLNGGTLLRIPLASLPLSLNAAYYVTLTAGIQDASGNSFAGDSYYFYVDGAAVNDNTPPTVQSMTPVNLSTSIGDNAPVRLVFSKLVDTLTINPSTVSLLNGATPHPYTVSFSTIDNGTQTTATLTPQAPLPDSAVITVSLTGGSDGIIDLAGNSIATQSYSFDTLAGADFSGPVVVERSVDNYTNSSVPVNATFTIVFNKPLDPATVTTGGFYIYDYSAGTVPMNPIHISADGLTVTLQPSANLGASDSLYYEWCGATDLDGNAAACNNQSFTTSSSPDATPPTVVATNPANGNAATVPTNAAIEVVFSEAVSATSLGAITLTAGGSVPIGAVLNNTIYTDDTVARLIPQQLLLPKAAYTVSVSGVKDIAGNTMSGTYAFTFTTGENFQTVGLTIPTVTVTTTAGPNTMPTSGTLPNVTDSPTFTVVFDHALDYASLLHGGITVRDIDYNLVPGVTLSYSMSADQRTVTVTASGLASATTYNFALEWGSTVWLYDVADNQTYNWGHQLYAFTTQ